MMLFGEAPEFAILLSFLLVFSIVVYRRKALDTEGILVADILGLLTYLLGRETEIGGFGAFAGLLFFFIIGEAATRMVQKKKTHEIRSTRNVIMNSTGPLLALFLQSPAGFLGGLSAVLSDTVSSEIGPLDRRKPRMILGFKKVDHGTDGAVSTLGLVAGMMGAALMGLFAFILIPDYQLAFAITMGGIIGNLVDSVAGAVLQKNQTISNAEVNLLCGLSGALAAVLVFSAW